MPKGYFFGSYFFAKGLLSLLYVLGRVWHVIFSKKQVRDRWIPIAVIAAPVITWIIDVNSVEWFNGYVFSHERLILNAALTFIGMLLLLKPQSTKSTKK